LNLTWDGTIYRSDKEWEDLFVRTPDDQKVLHAALSDAQSAVRRLTRPRLTSVPSHCVDPWNHYNATLFHLSKFEYDGTLTECMTNGVQAIGQVDFEIRGVIHLAGKGFPVPFPESDDGISLKKQCARVHLLHGTVGEAPNGSETATIQFHLENGKSYSVPIHYATDVKTRWFDVEDRDELAKSKAAWVRPPDQTRSSSKGLRLYVKSWDNPEPNVKIESIKFLSGATISAPFLIAITTE